MISNPAPSLDERPEASDRAIVPRTPRLWGLRARDLHDAYWRGLGVQVLRRGSGEAPDPAADLYLLVEPSQLVLFAPDALVEHIAWRAAGVTRVRIAAHDGDDYGEHVETDGDGRVRAVLRRYEPRTRAAWRVLIVRRARIARAWTAPTADETARDTGRRAAWRAVRRAARYDVDAVRIDGTCARDGSHRDECRLVDELVRTWHDPDRVIEGLRRLDDRSGDDRVFACAETLMAEDATLVGPAWIGADASADVVIGPAWAPDAEETTPLTVRAIRDIEPEAKFRRAAPKPRERWLYETGKRLFDLTACLGGMVVLLPVFVGVCVAVILDDGRPVLFGQRRQGRGGREFTCWKFRTMVRDADVIKARLANLSTGPQFFMRDDPRVTRVGAFLRKSHLDELPQLINVIAGDMSLVGPRPSPEKENRVNPAWREIRLSVRPGVTGLWQLRRTRRPDLDFQEWIRYDTEYVERRSFWMDMRILFGTLWKIARGSASTLDLPDETDPKAQ